MSKGGLAGRDHSCISSVSAEQSSVLLSVQGLPLREAHLGARLKQENMSPHVIGHCEYS